jgi:hypothetical protein
MRHAAKALCCCNAASGRPPLTFSVTRVGKFCLRASMWGVVARDFIDLPIGLGVLPWSRHFPSAAYSVNRSGKLRWH